MKKIVIFSLLILIQSLNLEAKPLISGLSRDNISLDARFAGTSIFLFGAKNTAGDVIVLIRGPKHNYTVRKKEKIGGIWLNKKQIKFKDIYSFYRVYSNKPLNKIRNQKLLKDLNIGIDNIDLEYTGKVYLEEISSFRKAIIENRAKDDLYVKTIENINFMGDTLFKANLIFPKKIPEGIYNVEIYLIDQNNLISTQIIPIEVKKDGISAKIFNFSEEHSILYGLFCVIAAIIAGWIASIIFWRV